MVEVLKSNEKKTTFPGILKRKLNVEHILRENSICNGEEMEVFDFSTARFYFKYP